MTGVQRPKTSVYVPLSALSVDSRILDIKLKILSTPERGNILGILKPTWTKTLESEMRLAWLKEMMDKKLVVRNLDHLGHNLEENLRMESSREEELSREILLELMRVKYIDERRNLRENKRIRETMRDWIRKREGRRRYDRLMEKIKQSLDHRREELKKKYKEKTDHLQRIRNREIMEKLEVVPSGLEEYSGCKIFDRAKMSELKPQEITHKLIGKVKIDETERAILNLNPKFAILKKLENIEVEQDIEICLAKIRYEIQRIEALRKQVEIEETEYGRCEERKRRRLEDNLTEDERKEEIIKSAKSRQTFDPQTKRFDYSKKNGN